MWVAGYTYSAPNIIIELEFPIYDDWDDAGTGINLTSSTDVYAYIALYNEAGDAGDSLVSDGEYVMLGDGICVDVAALVRLRPTAGPVDCDDVPEFFRDVSDINLDCRVDLLDFAAMASEWATCNDPENITCQQ